MTPPSGAHWPSHAYVPGLTERHPDDAFDDLKRTVRPGAAAHELAACEAFRTALRWLDAGYGWEAHELLEPVWMALPDGGAERRFVQALIQLANGRLKLAMARPKAALRLVRLARELLPPGGAVPPQSRVPGRAPVPSEGSAPSGSPAPPSGPDRILGVAVRDVRSGIDELESACASLD